MPKGKRSMSATKRKKKSARRKKKSSMCRHTMGMIKK